jgi:PAS domain S-box-containing protein
MNPVTALCLVALGASQLASRSARSTAARRFRIVLGASVAVIAAIKLGTLLAGGPPSVDLLLFPDRVQAADRAMIAPNAAVGLLLLGTAVALCAWSRRFILAAQIAALMALFITLSAIVNYGYGALNDFSFPSFSSMALPTALGLMLVSVGVLSTRPSAALIGVLTEPSFGGRTARRLLPIVTAITLVAGVGRVELLRYQLVDEITGIAMLVTFLLATMIVVVFLTADQLRRIGARLAERTAEAVASSERFSTAFEEAPIGMALVGLEGQFLKVNTAFAEIVGYERDDLTGVTFQEITHPDDLDADLDLLRQLSAGQIPHYRMEKRYFRKDGSEVWIDLAGSMIANQDGSPQSYIAQVQDLSLRKAAEAQLKDAVAAAEQANQAKSGFLAVMSHEIRTPLNGVLGMAQAMAVEDLGQAQRERLDVIRQSGETLLAILNDMLDLSKIEAGRLELEAHDFSVSELARGAHGAFTAVANKKGLSFDIKIDADARGLYTGDSTRVRQILYNLISNALKFTEHGQVQVLVSRQGEHLVFEVSDTGIGIPASRLPFLFQRFEQVDYTTTRRFGGTGLGLAICRELSELMGGRIDVQSEADKGSTFKVRLPLPCLGEEPPNSAPTVPAAELQRVERPLKVLAAEDNTVNQLVLRTVLQQMGIIPKVVSDGLEAVAAWEREPWDVILMDIQMPHLDGPGAVARIRQLEAETGRIRTPIVALSANAMAHQVEAYLAGGMDACVSKPIEVPKLFAALDNVLSSEPRVV